MADAKVVDIATEPDSTEEGGAETEGVAWERDKELSIYERIHAIMAEVSHVAKKSEMVMGTKTISYTSHDEATEAVRAGLVKYGIMVLPSTSEWATNGNRVEMLVNIQFINIDKPEDLISVKVPGFGVDPHDKGPGKAFSYAIKIATLKLFQLIGGNEPEDNTIEHDPAQATASQDAAAKNKAIEEQVEWAETFKAAILNAKSAEEIDRLYRANNKMLREVPKSTRDYFADLRERRTDEFADAK